MDIDTHADALRIAECYGYAIFDALIVASALYADSGVPGEKICRTASSSTGDFGSLIHSAPPDRYKPGPPVTEWDRPQSPFAGQLDFSARPPVRKLSPEEIERQLAGHRLYLETEWRQGHRANFASADLTGRDFAGLNLRGIKMDRALLKGADCTRAGLQRANLIGALLEDARLDDADLVGARLSGA